MKRMPASVVLTVLLAAVSYGALMIIRNVRAAQHEFEEMRERQYQLTYEAWCKLESRTDIAYAEWTRLRREGLLKHSGR